MTASSTVAEIVIARFGGLTSLARDLGHENPTTVQGWKERGTIPLAHWPAIERAAALRGFTDITAAWLLTQHTETV